uniref:Uncharacterized protein n=1 Tax=Oryza meridionalis TaxID=40149 RepID=A0A0E0E3Y3_9ORYZ
MGLREALHTRDTWLETRGVKNAVTSGAGARGGFTVVTWGYWEFWDCRTTLVGEYWFKGINKPEYFNRWINLKAPSNRCSAVAMAAPRSPAGLV